SRPQTWPRTFPLRYVPPHTLGTAHADVGMPGYACMPVPSIDNSFDLSAKGNSMEKLKRISVTVPTLLVLMAASFSVAAQVVRPESVGLSSERLERIGELMDRHIEAGSFSGAVTLVARDGRIAHLEAHGLMDIEAQEPMR